ncbi:hypothetical protein [Nocardia cerradoensis]|uniref:Uncharacterized protein n=1 Tax=Nocardia cerradoensis TaxID=85688 RepID=A0A231GTC7_9NOCA|nr:hypothetical protein [Nocardia cerradoensis]NKY43561.1 hypothetical protein [Nocardia cerradoensis]OXR39731.1 hypothetical protein B7C42_08192 [Nocardia cerradoensis]
MSPRRGRARLGTYNSPYFHGYRSTSPSPILAFLGALVGGVVLLLVVLPLTHAHTTHTGGDTAPGQVTTSVVAPPRVLPTTAATPAHPCYPFEPSC